MASVTLDTLRNESAAYSLQTDGAVVQLLRSLGSLKLTVTLLACSLALVLVGTLAQDEMNMLDVKQRYFLSWIAMMHLDDFFPQAFFPHKKPIPGAIPFPGGALIGALLLLNLVCAKATRFRVHASAGRTMVGVAFLIAGAMLVGAVVLLGQNSDGLQGMPPISYDQLWSLLLATFGVVAVGLGVGGVRAENSGTRIAGISIATILFLLVGYCLMSGFRIGDPGLRIVWQLSKGLGAGLVLMVGCLLLFGKQGGNMLLHLGVGLLMVGQFAFGDRQLEQRLSLVEGESSNTLVNLDRTEFTFIESSGDADRLIAIPTSRIVSAAASGQVIQDDTLPADVRVLKFYENAALDDVTEDNPANTGVGLEVQAKPLDKVGGTESRINLAAAYVELLEKNSQVSLGKFLVSQSLADREMLAPGGSTKNVFDSVKIGDVDYKLGLRFHREVKPYWVQLQDVQRINYSGTSTPRDYSSFIRIIDRESGEDRKERVWMNNPLRYRGETFYQSSYDTLPSGKELTSLQVVRNAGWLIPYVACSITALGMFVHFSGTLSRFLRRRSREVGRELIAETGTRSGRWTWLPVVGMALFGLVMLVPWSAVMNSLRPGQRMTKYDFHTAGKIPVQADGRVKPLDAFARQTLKSISNKESLTVESLPPGFRNRVKGDRISAMQWLMEVAIDEPGLNDLPMIRIDAEEVRSELNLNRRKSKLYSLRELEEHIDRVEKIANEAFEKQAADRTFKDKKLIELAERLRQYRMTAAAFRLPTPPEIPASWFPEGISEQARQSFALRELERMMESIRKLPVPAIIPPPKAEAVSTESQPKWSPFAPAFFDMAKSRAKSESGEYQAIDSFGEMIKYYADHDVAQFNQAVDSHLKAVQAHEISLYSPAKVSVERWLESNWPTGVALIFYIVCVVLGIICFGVDLPSLRQITWGTLCVAFLIHTVAIGCNMYITGRAPVINLYSSAVFIGWAAVLFGLVIERIFRYGIGNTLSASVGMLTLLVSYGLSTGDTMPVLQAVLDTQFWLATHVISVTLGYVATLVAGTLGIGYLVVRFIGKPDQVQRDVYRMCYGASCFGILFSFVGTVLGGLWADDSWGRFWGWDPKENGALLIVIWNALMLHARWDAMVGARGFSILAIIGNIVTAWSWFGTNELGIGLHSYGFTSGVLMWLSIFVGVQMFFIVFGLVLARHPTSDLELK